jgi:NAD(P)-dependent dehydrogenase (short-subunit alcohol dehydrogenase family)
MELGLRGKKALVTGASKGIGRACAEVLAEEGCDVVLVSRTAADLETARAAIVAKHNVAVRFYPLDLSDSRNVDKLAAECADIEILVNNAGAIPGGNIDAIDEARWREAWDLKVFGYVNMTRRFYALMRERKKGVIVNIIGAAGENPDFDYVAGSSGERVTNGVHARDGRHGTARWAAGRRHQPRPGVDRPAHHADAHPCADAVRRCRTLDRIYEAARLRPCRQTRRGRVDGGVSRLRSLRLHDRLDHHDRRRRLEPPLGAVNRYGRKTAKTLLAFVSQDSTTKAS